MPFKYNDTHPDKIVFTKLGVGFNQFLFISIGSIFTIIGFCLFYFIEETPSILSIFQFIFPAFGIMVIGVGIMLPKIQSENIPDQIIFDNPNGRIEINQKASVIKTAYIYYDEIDDFTIHFKKIETSRSTGLSPTLSSYSCHIFLTKKDGGQWELLKRNSEREALEEIAKLKTRIHLSAKPKRVTLNIKDSKKYHISKGSNKTELSWRNRLGFSPVFLVIFTISFLTVAYAISSIVSSMGSSLSVFFYFVIGFIGFVFIWVVGGNTLKMIKNAKTIYAVGISHTDLDYFERDHKGEIKKNIKFPLIDIHALSFSFDTENTVRKIFIYTHEQFKKKDSLDLSLNVDSIKNYYNFYKEVAVLELQNITAVEALYIEAYLQQQISERGNIKVA